MAEAEGSTASPSRTPRRLLVVALLVLVVGALLAVVLLRPGEDAPPAELAFDADLCPTDPEGIAASATLVLDTGKPLGGAPSPSAVLRDVSLEMAPNTELHLYAVRENPNAPLTSLGRLCKPYDSSQLSVAMAKDQREASRDCDDLPAQLTPFVREAAQRFCVRRNELGARVDELAKGAPRRVVAASHLVDALLQARRSLVRRKAPRTLYVYSDMLQHADWYSHFDLDWTQWRTEYTARQDAAANGAMTAKILYLPRQDITEPLRPRRVHQEYWRAFFDGADVTFADYEPVPRYATLPLMDAAAAGLQEEGDPALDEERAKIEELRERLRAESAALAEQRQQSIAARETLANAEQALDAPADATQGAVDSPPEAPPNQAASQPNDVPPDLPTGDAAFSEGEPGAAPPAVGNDQANAQEAQDALPVAAPPPPQLAVGTGEPPPSLEVAAAFADDAPPCPATLGAPSQTSLAPGGYPGGERVNYGAGVLVFDYALDERGAIVDTGVAVRRDLSNMEMPEHFDALAADTIADMMAWQFDFADTDGNCSRAQRGTATFTYASRCVGAPRPSCRTVRTSVALR